MPIIRYVRSILLALRVSLLILSSSPVVQAAPAMQSDNVQPTATTRNFYGYAPNYQWQVALAMAETTFVLGSALYGGCMRESRRPFDLGGGFVGYVITASCGG